MSIRELSPEERAVARGVWERDRAVMLPRWVGGELLRTLLAACSGSWTEDPGTGDAFRFSVRANLPEALLDDLRAPAVCAALSDITGVTGLRGFEGQLKRLTSEEGQRFPWHRDHRHGQLLGLSVNLSERAYSGGVFELRRRWVRQAEVRIEPNAVGDTHLIDVADAHRVHRVTPVVGEHPRLFLAGWYVP